MKKIFVLLTLVVFFSAYLEESSFARAGGGSRGSSSYGSRGSRTYAPPARQAQPQQQNQMQRQQAQPQQQHIPPAAPQPSPWGGFMRGMAGGLVGGMLASMLFRGLGMGSGFGSGGFGGGIGMIEIILIGLIIFVIYKMVKSKKEQAAMATSQGYGRYNSPEPQQTYQFQGNAASAQQDDLSAGLSYIRQFDSTFDENRFKETAGDIFFKVQAAWMQRDIGSVGNILAPEISDQMRKDIAQLRADGRINRLENIAMRNVSISEAWQEEGKDFITVEFTANVLDYVTDEAGRVLEGSNKEPVKFVEYWTFMRKIGTTNWQLSAIQQE